MGARSPSASPIGAGCSLSVISLERGRVSHREGPIQARRVLRQVAATTYEIQKTWPWRCKELAFLERAKYYWGHWPTGSAGDTTGRGGSWVGPGGGGKGTGRADWERGGFGEADLLHRPSIAVEM
jgi:hypothetical protein